MWIEWNIALKFLRESRSQDRRMDVALLGLRHRAPPLPFR